MTYLTNAHCWQLDYFKIFTILKSILIWSFILLLFSLNRFLELKLSLETTNIFKILSAHFQIASQKAYVQHRWNICIYTCTHTHMLFFLTIFYFLNLFIYLFLAVLGLRFCVRAFSSCGKRGPLFIAVRGPLTVAASFVAEHRLQTRRLSSCGSRA